MKTLHGRRKSALGVLLAALVATLCLGAVSTASAAKGGPSATSKGNNPACAGRGVPTSKISVQLFTFSRYIGGGAGAAMRLEEVLRRLSEMGYRNVEPYSLHGLTAEQFRALLGQYGLKASSRHVNIGTPTSPANIEQIIEENRILGIKYFGSGSTPRTFTSAEQWVAYAEYLDQVGEQARMAGQQLIVHTHNWEFTQVFGGQTAFDILMANTDPRNVSVELDLYWAELAGADPVELLERYPDRIELLHVKDLNPALNNRIEIVGRGNIDFPSIFAATQGPARYYVVEHDPPSAAANPTFDPFVAAQEGFDYLACVTY